MLAELENSQGVDFKRFTGHCIKAQNKHPWFGSALSTVFLPPHKSTYLNLSTSHEVKLFLSFTQISIPCNSQAQFVLLPRGGEGGGVCFLPNLQQSRSPLIVTLAVASGFRVWKEEGRKEQGTSHIKPTKEDGKVAAEIVLLHPKGLTLNPLYIKLNFSSPKGAGISFFQRIFPWYLLSFMGKSMEKVWI